MSAESLKASVEDLIAELVGGKPLMLSTILRRGRDHAESEQPPRVGKAACRAFEADFLSKIKAVWTYVCDRYVISGDKAFIVYRIDADHAHWGTLKMSEVAIRSGQTEKWCARNLSTDQCWNKRRSRQSLTLMDYSAPKI